jgi:alpha-tubulin suppressor-like RCC1 family protein
VTGGGTNWQRVTASSGNHALATKIDGTLWAWGQNTCGQLGDGTTINKSSPTLISGFTDWAQLSSGQCHTVGLNFAGNILSWGYNGLGQLGINNTTTQLSPVRERSLTSSWKCITTGCDHTMAIKTDGTLWTWGSNVCGVLGTNNTTNRSSPGTVSGGGTTWYSISSEWNHNLAIKTDGTLWTWGSNTCGQLGTGNTINRSSPATTLAGGTNWCNISAGNCFSAAIKADGTLWTWGINTCGQLGDGTVIVKTSPATTTGGGTTWVKVHAGCAHTLAKKTDGSLWSWGHNNCGQLGDESLINRSSPVTVVTANTNWTEVSAGAGYNIGVQSTIIIA